MVIGGGLLGLEAANALRSFGLHAHVVEMAPRLMAQQLDEAGGALLGRMIAELGISVHIGVGTASIAPAQRNRPVRRSADDDSMRVTLSDGTSIDAGLVVFAAGVRPRDELARDAGLDIAERGGVLTDLSCATSDPNIFAVGEVAAIEGRCYGLVGPGYTSAEVAADRLLGGEAEFPEADMSTKLKLLGVDVASFGDAMGTTPDCLEVVVNDAVKQTYAKLVLSDDAKTLLGGILVGDASAYGILRPMVGEQLPGDPLALIAPAGSDGAGAGLGVGALPAGAQICSCNNVTKGDLTDAIAGGCCDVPDLKKCTLAGTSCGSCVPLLKQLLEAEGVEQSKALCEHFSQSRAELFEIVSATSIRTFSALIERFGTGKGCDICKPAVASILASTSSEHILDGEQASLQDSNDHFLANIQKNGSYSIVPRVPGGDITPEQLILIGEIARDFDLYTKITGGQRIDMFGARVDQLPEIWRRLVDGGMESGHAYGKALRTVKSCVGSDWCRYGQQDSVQMAINLELRYRGLRAPHKIKMGVSGCARECAEARGKDVGVIATENGWNLYVGGNGGMTPKHAQLLAGDLDDETLVRYIDRFLMFYIRTADRLQRTAPWVDALDGGLDHLRDVVCNDSLGLAAEFEEAIARHVEGYACEWKGVLEDPDKLSRFVSFVNAPDVADPTVEFTRAIRPQSSHRTTKGAPKMTLVNDIQVWTAACAYDRLIPCRGVGVLLADGTQAALFRLDDGSLHAVGNIDPFSGAAVISRGIVGDRGGRPTVQSPIKKQAFGLDDGVCLDDAGVTLPVYVTRVTADGNVEIGAVANRPMRLSGVGKDGGEHPRCGLAENIAARVYAATASRARRNRLAISRTIAGCAPSGAATASAPLSRKRS